MKKIGIAVVGLGWAAQGIHLPRFREIPEIDFVGVTDASEDRRRETAVLYGVKEYPDCVSLCEDKAVDAVFILTPPSAHDEIARLACENGKHIFCEKPIALSASKGEAMVNEAQRADVVLMVGYMMRFFSNLQLMKNVLPLLGSGLKAQTEFVMPLPRDKATFQYQRNLGGGALFEMGTHHVDLLRWFFGDAKPIDVDMEMIGDVDIATSFSLDFGGGVTVQSKVSWVGHVSRNSVFVEGGKGYARTNCSVRTGEKLVHFSLNNIFHEAGDLAIRTRDERDIYVREIEHFVKCVSNGEPPLCPGEDALEDLRLVLNIYQLWESH